MKDLDPRDSSRELSNKIRPESAEELLRCTRIQEKKFVPVCCSKANYSELILFSFAFQPSEKTIASPVDSSSLSLVLSSLCFIPCEANFFWGGGGLQNEQTENVLLSASDRLWIKDCKDHPMGLMWT